MRASEKTPNPRKLWGLPTALALHSFPRGFPTTKHQITMIALSVAALTNARKPNFPRLFPRRQSSLDQRANWMTSNRAQKHAKTPPKPTKGPEVGLRCSGGFLKNANRREWARMGANGADGADGAIKLSQNCFF